jgi:hypothetical protein
LVVTSPVVCVVPVVPFGKAGVPERFAAVVAEVALVALVAVAAFPPTEQLAQVPVRLVITPDAGVPSAGVVKDGETSGAFAARSVVKFAT